MQYRFGKAVSLAVAASVLWMGGCSLEDGDNGLNGQDGVDGVDGQDGQDGVDGQDGQDGADGLGFTFTDNFPGTQIYDHYVSDDERALNHADAKIVLGMNTFWNADNGTAIVLYTDSYERLWAHYFDGTNFTPAREIRMPDQLDQRFRTFIDNARDPDDEFGTIRDYQVLFLNTSAYTNGNATAQANARARDGDAIILFARHDNEPSDTSLSPDGNTRLAAAYFDVSEAGNAVSSGDVKFGFQTVATVLDFDNTVSGADDNVTSFGFVSNSLLHSHLFQSKDIDETEDGQSDVHRPDAIRSGDATSFAYMVWRKGQNDGTASVAARFHASEFDLTQASNVFTPQPSNQADELDLPGGMSLVSGTAVEEDFIVHNGHMLWRATESTSSRVVLLLTRFEEGGSVETIELSNGATLANTLPRVQDVYGDDHGLTSLYAFYTNNSRLFAAKSDLDAALARETSQIDNSSGTTLSTGTANLSAHYTQINRTGEWIFAAWTQDVSSTAQAHVQALQTRTSATTRSLANSLSGATELPNQYANRSIQKLTMQSEVADGTQDPSMGIQSNRNRLNVVFQQFDTLSTAVVNLVHNGVTVTLASVNTAPPSIALALTGLAPAGMIAQNDENYLDNSATVSFNRQRGASSVSNFVGDMRPVLADLGGTAGEGLVYFLRNDNNPTDASTGFDEVRIYGSAAGATPVLVSTDGDGLDNSLPDFDTSQNDNWLQQTDDFVDPNGQFLRVVTTPRNADNVGSPNHAGSTLHLFFIEPRHSVSSGTALRSRLFNKTVFATSTNFTTAHSPALTADPLTLDLDSAGEAYLPPTNQIQLSSNTGKVGPRTAFVTTSGSTVGIYFQSDRHFYYQEFNGTSWIVDANGEADPQLIDNETGATIFPGRDQQAYAFPPTSLTSNDNFNNVLCFYAKQLPGEPDPGKRRWFVRVHD